MDADEAWGGGTMSNPSYSRVDVRMLQRRIMSMIDRGVVTSVDDALMMQTLDVELKSGFKPTKVEHWHPYGMSYHPHKDAEVLAFSLGGNPDHVIIMPASNREYRIKGMQQGEFAVHDDLGQFVHFKRDGLHMKSPMKVTVECPEINLGGDGGKPVAIEGTVDSAGHPLVSNFSTRVKAV